MPQINEAIVEFQLKYKIYITFNNSVCVHVIVYKVTYSKTV